MQKDKEIMLHAHGWNYWIDLTTSDKDKTTIPAKTRADFRCLNKTPSFYHLAKMRKLLSPHYELEYTTRI